MTKWIAEHSELAPSESCRLVLEPCARRDGAFDGRANIADFEIEMYRRPMPMIVAAKRRLTRRQASRRFFQEIDRRRRTEHLGDRTTEKAPTDVQTECSAIEIDAAFDVVDVDVHEKLHQGTSAQDSHK